MAEISNLGYLGFAVSDLDRWATFAEDLLGLQVSHRDGESIGLRMDDYRQRFFLEKHPADDVSVAGWEFGTEPELDQFVADARAKGAEVSLLPAAHAKKRFVEKVYTVADPNGYQHELFFGPDVVPLTQPFRSKVLKSSFVTGPLGLGHFLPMSKNGPQTLAFYRDILKLRTSDYIRQEVGPGMVVDATFFHTKTGRHHSIATAEAPTPKVLNHVMVQVADMDDVGLAYDRCVRAGQHIAAELGHHPNDQMFSFYVRSPSGFNIEFGWGGLVIDDANWKVTNYTQMSDWGHKRNPVPVDA